MMTMITCLDGDDEDDYEFRWRCWRWLRVQIVMMTMIRCLDGDDDNDNVFLGGDDDDDYVWRWWSWSSSLIGAGPTLEAVSSG